MSKGNIAHLFIIMLVLSISGMIACGDEDIIGPAPFPTDPVVFVDEFGSSIEYQAFSNSHYEALTVGQFDGSTALKFDVLDTIFTGGAFVASIARDLSIYNALTFRAKASREVTLDVVGIGNDNTGGSIYTAELNNVALTTSWQTYTIPLPLAEKLLSERGMFYFAEGPEDGVGCSIWFDDIVFENISTITDVSPAITTESIDAEVGETLNIGNGLVTFDVNGTEIVVNAMPAYFTLISSNSAIVSVADDGVITTKAVGIATLTAKLGEIDATGTITVNVGDALPVPTTAAPSPTVDPADVVSLFSDSYTNANVSLWSTDWDITEVEDITIGANNIKKYYDLTYAGIEFNSPSIDVSTMTRFHIDVWTPNSTDAPANLKIKLVDFGANDIFGGGDDTEHELTFDHTVLASQSWVGIDVPLATFSGLTGKNHLAQMIISGSLTTVYIDNIYFYDAGVQTEPTSSAPTPSYDQANVVSLFSDAYTDITVETWSTIWDQATVADFAYNADNMKKYTNLTFAAIEFKTSTVDATALTHFHLDLWTPDATTAPAEFNIKLVDFGADGSYGGGDDVESEISWDYTKLNTGIWVSVDIPISDFTGLTTKSDIGQMIISGDLSTVFLDNVSFYNSGIPTEPNVSAPTPTLDAADVVSLFSDVYTDVPVETWSAPWDSANVVDFMIGSDVVKKYTNLLFAGVEFKDPTIDGSAMTHLHLDFWTPDATNAPTIFKIKLVDFGANGVWDGGGDDVEHELTIDESQLGSNTWVSLDIPLSDFVNLTTRGHLAQMIIVTDPNTLYIDNVYLHK